MRRFGLTLFCMILMTLSACGGSTSTPPPSSSPHDLIGRGMPKTRPDMLAERRIILRYPYNGETVDTVYYHDHAYDQNALAEINRLCRDRHAGVVGPIDRELVDYLVDIRTRLNLPDTVVFEVLSAYRTPETNARLAISNSNVAKESLHMHGWAIDFRIAGVSGKAISAIAKTMQRGGVSYYPSDNHVHVDLGNIRTWPTSH